MPSLGVAVLIVVQLPTRFNAGSRVVSIPPANQPTLAPGATGSIYIVTSGPIALNRTSGTGFVAGQALIGNAGPLQARCAAPL